MFIRDAYIGLELLWPFVLGEIDILSALTWSVGVGRGDRRS